MDMSLSELREMVMDREAWRAVIHGVAKSRRWLSDWTELREACLENPMDRGAWWAAVHTVTQSRIYLKWLIMHSCIREENGNPLQYSYLENPRDRGAWWAAIFGSHRVGRDWTDLAAAVAGKLNVMFKLYWCLFFKIFIKCLFWIHWKEL